MTRAIALAVLSGLLVSGCDSSDPAPATPTAPSPAPAPAPPAAPARIDLSASPARFLLTGGNTSVAVTGRVISAAGAGLADRTVQFTTTSGSLSASATTTNANGDANVTLTTSGSATVLASASGVDGSLNIVGVAPFTVAVEPRYSVVGFDEADDVVITVTQAQGFANVPVPNSIMLDCGNGVKTSVGSSLRESCRYRERGSHLVTVTATSASGWTSTATATITMDPRPVTLSLTSRRVAGSTTEVEMEFTVVGAPAQSVCTWDLGVTGRVGDCSQRYVYHKTEVESGEVKIRVAVDTKQGQDVQTFELDVTLVF